MGLDLGRDVQAWVDLHFKSVTSLGGFGVG